MTNIQLHARNVFLAAIELPSQEERAEFVARECRDDHELQLAVQRLLASHRELGSFCESRDACFSAERTALLEVGQQSVGAQIGHYKLREQIGEGGMGVVYVAEQTEPVKRKVALKIIKPGMASRDVVARFEAERQALAMMDHPSIARVFDGGVTESGHPYFVMELVQGLPITEYCDQHSLSTRERLTLFVTVCRAVQHAHQRGVIHRDLKPSNILVAEIDATSVPKVIDYRGEGMDSLQSTVAALSKSKPYLIGVLGDAYGRLSSAQEAAGNLHDAIESQQRNLEVNRQLRDRFPNNLRFVSGGAANRLQLASLLRQTGRHEEALAQAQAAVAMLEDAMEDAMAGTTPDAPVRNLLYARMALRDSYRETGSYLKRFGRHEEAAVSYRRAIAAEADALRGAPRTLVSHYPNRLYDAWLEMQRLLGDDREVGPVLRGELETWQQLEHTSQFKESFRLRQMEVHLRLAQWLLRHNRPAEAVDSYRAAGKLFESLLANRHSQIMARAVAVCLHVCADRRSNDVAANEQRGELLKSVNDVLEPALELTRERAKASAHDTDGWFWDIWSELAYAYYQPRQWNGAEVDAREAIELAGEGLAPLQKITPLLLLAGQHEDYFAFCQDLLKGLDEQRGDPLTYILHICLLAPEPTDPALLLQAARRVAKEQRDDYLLHVALYRNGQFDQAIEGLKGDLKFGIHSPRIVQLHLAIAHKLAGDDEAARDWLAKTNSPQHLIWRPEEKVAFEVLYQQITDLQEQAAVTAIEPSQKSTSNSIP